MWRKRREEERGQHRNGVTGIGGGRGVARNLYRIILRNLVPSFYTSPNTSSAQLFNPESAYEQKTHNPFSTSAIVRSIAAGFLTGGLVFASRAVECAVDKVVVGYSFL